MKPVPSFILASDDVPHGGTLAPAQILDGGNQSPHLRWEGFPAQTASFAITCFDPDAATGSGWWHWVLFDIPAHITELPAGAGSGDFPGLPAGAIHARNDYGTKDYGGAAPPPGTGPHRYVFTVHALSVDKLRRSEDTSPAGIGGSLGFYALARASVIAEHEVAR